MIIIYILYPVTRISEHYHKLIAELLGTMLLVATVVGSGIMAQNLSDDIGVQLTMNMLATAFILFLLISIFGPISGAHFNPAVSMVFLITKGISAAMFALYVLVQLIGGLLGSVIANAMFSLPTVISTRERLDAGAPLSEIIATAGLVLTILLLIRHNQSLVAVGVATWIGSAYFFTSSTSFANPAVTFGRIFTESFAGIEPVSALAFIGLQLVGALVGFGIYKLLEGKNG